MGVEDTLRKHPEVGDRGELVEALSNDRDARRLRPCPGEDPEEEQREYGGDPKSPVQMTEGSASPQKTSTVGIHAESPSISRSTTTEPKNLPTTM